MNYAQDIEKWLQEASEVAQGYFGRVTGEVKAGDNNQVLTEADLAIGKLLVANVKETYPDHNIIDEEAGVVDNGSRFTWVIDPIDGTSNFVSGLPHYGVMIGLLDEAQPVAGGVVAPAFGAMYLAERGRGATRNGEPIRVTTETKLSNVLVSYGIDGYPENPERTIRECRLLADVILAIRNMRNSGCDALDPMYVAEGKYGGRVNLTSKIWDNVAPQIIAEEAGAVWTTLDGSPIDYTNPLGRAEQNFDFCVASPVLHEQLQRVIHARS